MNIFGVGLPEIAVIGAIALIVFGPKRLPELGKTLGKTLKGFQTASNEFEREIQKAMSDEGEPSESINTVSTEKGDSSQERQNPPISNNNPET
tara:strand:+ start:10 stop:288 length:279 start_codon:yes stop_codon:yes gene_type:complete